MSSADAAVLGRSVAMMQRRQLEDGVLVQMFLSDGIMLWITKLEVIDEADRGKGMARAAMADVCAWADEHGCMLGLSPDDRWGADVKRLRVFFGSLGFVDNRGPQPYAHDDMVRYPKESPKVGEKIVAQ
jgi:GNAT superfamily N-acetyltransferase